MRMFVFRIPSGIGAIVAADSLERAKEMLAEPALVEMKFISPEFQVDAVFAEELDSEAIAMALLMGVNVLSEAVVMAAKSSVEAFRNSELRYFGNDNYIIAAKDRDGARSLLSEIGKVAPGAETLLASIGSELPERAKEQFAVPPKVVSQAVLDWYKARAQELPMMPMPQYVM